MKKALILAALVVMAGTASAQRVQFGVRAGVFSQDMELSVSDIMTEAQLGWNAAFVSRVRLVDIGGGVIGMGLYLQPEIVYSQNSYKMQQPGGEVTKISMRDVDVPVLLSFRISIVRIQAGPVFNVMHKTPTKRGDMDLASIRPTVGYGLGASVDIIKGLVLDGRYNGNFKKLQDNIRTGDDPARSIKASLSSWSVGLSWLF